MNHQQMLKPMLIGAAVLVVLAVAGLPVGALVLPLVVLACPLMMFFMMRNMDHGGHDHSAQTARSATEDER